MAARSFSVCTVTPVIPLLSVCSTAVPVSQGLKKNHTVYSVSSETQYRLSLRGTPALWVIVLCVVCFPEINPHYTMARVVSFDSHSWVCKLGTVKSSDNVRQRPLLVIQVLIQFKFL